MSQVEILSPVLRDNPSEWKPIDPERVEALRINPVTRTFSQAQAAEMERIASERWYLLSNWLKFRSRDTNRIEANFTLGGIERPFNGLDSILMFVAQSIGAEAQSREMLAKLLDDNAAVELIEMGVIKPITKERAEDLCFQILLRTGIDIVARKGDPGMTDEPMRKRVTYDGPAANLIVGDTTHHPGDTFLIEPAVVRSLIDHGHHFSLPDDGGPIVPAPPPAAPEALSDQQGMMLDADGTQVVTEAVGEPDRPKSGAKSSQPAAASAE